MPVSEPRTMVEVLRRRADRSGDRIAYRYSEEPRTFAELWDGVTRVASRLRDEGVQPGDRVIALLPNGHDFFPAFYGVQLRGATAVPLFPASHPARVLAVAGHCGARLVLLPSGTEPGQLVAFRDRAAKAGITVLTVAECLASPAQGEFPEVAPGSLAFLQYTSGSTGDPKGVMLTHANLLANVTTIIDGLRITEAERFVSWLPVYHDLGLVLMTAVPFYLAAELFLYPTSLTDVQTWLRAITEHRGTLTAAPDFAFRLCLRNVRDPAGYDLSSLRLAVNAAEPVRAATIEAFERTFGLRNVVIAGYGLAEATVGVCGNPPGTPNRVDDRGFVSVGPPLPRVDLAILMSDGDGTSRLGRPGEIGEILVRSPSGCAGYWDAPEKSQQLVQGDGFLRTGDLGYLDEDGYLFIVGRAKNVILTGGGTIAPSEVEETADRQPLVRFSAALGIDRGGVEGEQIYVFSEVREAEGDPAVVAAQHAETARAIVADVHERIGLRPARVILLRPRSIPLTYNGKVQHVRLKELYLSGELARSGAVVYPPAVSSGSESRQPPA